MSDEVIIAGKTFSSTLTNKKNKHNTSGDKWPCVELTWHKLLHCQLFTAVERRATVSGQTDRLTSLGDGPQSLGGQTGQLTSIYTGPGSHVNS